MTARDDFLDVYRTIAEHLSQGIALIEHGEVIYANPALARLTGYSREHLQTLQASGVASLIHPADLPVVFQHLALEDETRSQGQVHLQTRLCTAQGETRWVEMYSSLLPHGVQQILCVDISDRVQAEESLHAQATWIEHLLDSVPIGIGMVQNRILTFANQTLCRWLGYAREELVGQSARILYVDDEEFARVGRKKIPEVLARGEGGIQTRFRCKDGTVVDVWLQTSLIDPQAPDKGMVSAVLNVTERVKQRRALLESEQRYRTLFENSPVALWEEDFSALKQWMDALRARGVQDLESWLDAHPDELKACVQRVRVLNVNQSTLQLYGAQTKEDLLQGFESTFPSESFRTFQEELLALWRGETTYTTEGVSCRLDGKRIYHTLRAHILPGYEDTWERVVVSMQDLTARREAELSLQESEQRYRQLVEMAPYGIGIHQDGRVVFANPAAARLLKAESPQELLGLSIEDIVHPDGIQEAMDRIRRMLAGETGMYPTEDRYVCRDGSVVPVEVIAAPFTFNGRPAIQVIAQDITERKRAEEALYQQVERTRRLLESTLDGYLLADEAGNILDANPAYCAMSGYTREELCQMRIRELEATLNEEQIRERISLVVQHGRVRFETRHRCKDGRVIILDASLTVFTDVPGKTLIGAFVRDITAQKQLLAHLQDSQAMLTTAEEMASLGSWVWDWEQGLINWSPEILRLFDITPDEIPVTWKALLSYVHPDDRTRIRKEIRAARHYQLFDMRFRIRRRMTGEVRWVHTRARLLLTDDGVRRMVGSVQDITNTVRNEQALERHNRRLRGLHALYRDILQARSVAEVAQSAVEHLYHLLPVLRVGCVRFDWQHELVYPLALRTAEGLKTYSMEDETPLDTFTDIRDLRQGKVVVRQQLPATASPELAAAGGRSYLKVPIRADGVLLGSLNLLSPQEGFWDEESQEIVCEVADIVAISWRQNALLEQERIARQKTEVLRGAMLTLSSTLDTDVILDKLLDFLGQILPYDSASVFLKEENGYRVVAVRGFEDSVALLGRVFPLGNPLMERLERDRTPIILSDAQKVPDFASWGDTWHIHGWLGAPMIAGGNVLGVITVDNRHMNAYNEADARIMQAFANQAALALENASLYNRIRQYAETLEARVEERTAELQTRLQEIETLNQALANLLEDIQAINRKMEAASQRLQEANTELEAFTYSVSHDLRAPLRAVQGFADILLEDYASQLDDAGKHYLSRIRESTRHLDTLIQDLLAYSRLTSAELVLQPIQLARVVQEVLRQQHTAIEQQGAIVEVASSLPVVLGDTPTLMQIFGNLISNALKFTHPERKPEIRVWAQAEGSHWRVWVEDNGIGIAPQYQKQIFRIFERLHGEETYPGTGVGLAIVQKAVERLHGEVGVESEPGRGSRFWVLLRAWENLA